MMELTKRPTIDVDAFWRTLRLVFFSLLLGLAMWGLVVKYQRGWWHVEIATDPITDAATAEAYLNSTQTRILLNCETGNGIRVSLVSLSGYSPYSEGNMLFRFDRREPISMTFADTGTSDVAAFAVSSSPFIKLLRQSQTLVMRNTSNHVDDQFFTLRGAARVVNMMETACRK